MARNSRTAQATSWPVPWLEIVLPIYTLAIVMVYYRPNSVHLAIADETVETIAVWAMWILGGVLGGVLAFSGLFLAFYLLYSPFYLAKNLHWALDPGVWTDPREVQFYLCCFGLLCALLTLAIWNPELALVVFTMLAGSAKLLGRLLL